MSLNSEKVSQWRRNTKNRMVAAMGGCCAICGYNKCNAALEFHHVNPEDKQFGLGHANTRAWAILVKELRKCVLLCSNCHKELHIGISQIPIDYQRFNEEYEDYKESCRIKQMGECPVCGKLKKSYNITCSKSCAAKRTGKIKWDDFDIVEMKKTMTNISIGELVGCSDVAVFKRLKKINPG